MDLLSEWRADGFGVDAVELWSIGYAGSTEDSITAYVNASWVTPRPATSACFADDDWAVYWAYRPSKDDVFVVDKVGDVVFFSNAASRSLYSEPYRSQLDSAVRAALAR